MSVQALDGEDLRAKARLGPGARLVAGWRLGSTDARFGGFSGILIDGDRQLLLSDRGWIWSTPRGSKEGAPFASGPWRVRALHQDGRPTDAEAIARMPDGTILIAEEGRHALARMPADDAGPFATLETLPLPEPLASLPPNRGIEALTGLADGRLLAIAEDGQGGRHVAAVIGAGPPRVFEYRTEPGFAPTGADRVGSWLFLLERAFFPLLGFEARVTVTSIDERGELPDVLKPTLELARLSDPRLIDNMEGIAAEFDDRTRTVTLWLVSDDNFNPFQRTLVLALEWNAYALPRASTRRLRRSSSDDSSAFEAERR